jgi:putative endonuclease
MPARSIDKGAQMTKKRKTLGRQGEDVACMYLANVGTKIIERNWKCQSGEADIIANDGDDLVFIEVKTRASDTYGFPEEAVNHKKRLRYERIATEYLFSHDLPSARVRFDVLALMLSADGKAFLRHHRDAFGVGD